MTETQVADRPVDSEAGAGATPRDRRGQTEPPPGGGRGARPARLARPAPTLPTAQDRTARLRAGLSTPAAVRAAILAREILGPPKALQER